MGRDSIWGREMQFWGPDQVYKDFVNFARKLELGLQ